MAAAYYPDLTRPERVFDLAVVAADLNELAVVGVNLTAFGLKDPNPFVQATIDNTFDVLVRRVEAAFDESPGDDTYLDILDRLVEGNLSNIQYRPITILESDEDPSVVAFNIFREAGRRQNLVVVSPDGTAHPEGEVTAVRPMSVTFGAARTGLGVKPFVLRLDEEDVAHLAIQPRYVTYGLKECARRTVLAPTQAFRGLKRGKGCPDNLRGAWAICGNPRQAVDNVGRLVQAPDGMVFVVYADAAGYVFDWDWVEEDPGHPGCPVDCDTRFGDPCTLPRRRQPGDSRGSARAAVRPDAGVLLLAW